MKNRKIKFICSLILIVACCSTITINAEVISSIASINAEKHLSWGATYMGFDNYRSKLVNPTNKVIVAVVDTGVEINHAFLKSRIIAGYDFVDGDSNPSDMNGHGTHVAGTIIDCTANMNNIYIMPIRVLDASGNGSDMDIANGILYAADNGASVINLSVGGRHSGYLEEAIEHAIKKGCTVVVAAGNESQDIERRKVCPAHIKDVITVGAVGSNFVAVQFSNYGESIDLTAPGKDITSAYLNGTYATLSGTSMAAPHVSAAVAMILSEYGQLSKTQMNSILLRACDVKKIGSKYGAGVLSLNNLVGSLNNMDYSIAKVEYSGQFKEPKVVFKRNNEALFAGYDYEISCDKSTDIGEKTITITGKGTYSGRIGTTFSVVPKGTTLSSIKKSGKNYIVKWKKQSEKTTGYQIRYSTNSSMKDAKTKSISGKSKTQCSLSKLKSGKKYYFQVRTYTDLGDGDKYYSPWSKKKSVKTTK